MVESLKLANVIFINLDKTVNEVGLGINENKAKIIMQMRKITPTRQNITMDEDILKNVAKFIYSGVQVTEGRNEVNSAFILLGSANIKS